MECKRGTSETGPGLRAPPYAVILPAQITALLLAPSEMVHPRLTHKEARCDKNSSPDFGISVHNTVPVYRLDGMGAAIGPLHVVGQAAQGVVGTAPTGSQLAARVALERGGFCMLRECHESHDDAIFVHCSYIVVVLLRGALN
jgi:hypothetical protein